MNKTEKDPEDEAFEELARRQGEWGLQGSRKHQILRYAENAERNQALADQEFILHDEENEGGWSDWVCPKPDSYLMKCCDCGLVHEMQTRVAKYEPKPSDTFVVPNDPDLQTQFRMRRHEVLKTTPPQRTGMIEILKQAIDYIENVPDDRDGVGHIDRHALVAALKEQLAQPEPIQSLQCFHCQVTIETLNDKVMHLMAERTWVGLTDEEKNDCLVSADPCETLAEPEARQLIEDVEQALKEKNNG
jgi:hypothetical protein